MMDLHNRWISVVMAAALLLAGCSTDALHENLPAVEEEPAGPSAVYIRLQMGVQSRGIPGSSRAGTGETEGSGTGMPAGENLTPGTTNENAVRTIDLFVCDAASGELLESIALSDAQIKQVIDRQSAIEVPIFVAQGSVVHIYAAVNMTERMRMEFIYGKKIDDIALASTRTDYWDVINEFVPGSDGNQQTLENYAGGCIPMTGQFTVVGSDSEKSEDIEITESCASKETAIKIRTDVGRIVAKVHVLTKLEDPVVGVSEKYARSRSGDKNIGSIGWIRQSDVRYMVNGTNKSTYLFAQRNDKTDQYGKDRNMNLENYVTSGVAAGIGSQAPAWAADFVYYNAMSLHKDNISASCHLAEAEPFDQTKLDKTMNGSDDVNRYVRGQYCPENYFDTPTSNVFDNYGDAIPMVTHVSIAAKLTPRWIIILENYEQLMDEFVREYELLTDKQPFYDKYGLTAEAFTNDDVNRWKVIKEKAAYQPYFTSDEYLYRDSFRIICLDNEQDAADILNWSLKFNHRWSKDPDDFENDKYPDGTFYVYDTSKSIAPNEFDWTQRYLYLTAGAFNATTDANIDIRAYSVPHLGGWGYYYTYLDQLQLPAEGMTPFLSSQVTRNTYYLITVGNFAVPGGSVSQPEYIKVNTEPVGWDYVGRGDVALH